MQRIFAATLGVLLVGTASLGAVSHATAARSHAISANDYAVATFSPMGDHKVTGAIVMMSGSGTTSGTTSSASDVSAASRDSGASAASRASSSGGMTITAIVEGLQPGSKALVHINATRCGIDKTHRYEMSLTANKEGVATASVKPSSALTLQGIYASVYGHSANSSAGSSRAGVTMNRLACGAVHTPGTVVQVKPVKGGRASGLAFITQNQPVLGNSVKKGTEVIVYATGLQPNMAQPNHIHAGPCGANAPIRYPLTTLVANSKGDALAGTGVRDQVPTSGLSLEIHKTNFDVEACGNIG